MFIFNDNTQHHWEVYDKDGHEVDVYYMKGYDSTPSFYISGATVWLKIDADNQEDMKFQIIPLSDVKKIKTNASGNFHGINTEAPGLIVLLKKEKTKIEVVDIEEM